MIRSEQQHRRGNKCTIHPFTTLWMTHTLVRELTFCCALFLSFTYLERSLSQVQSSAKAKLQEIDWLMDGLIDWLTRNDRHWLFYFLLLGSQSARLSWLLPLVRLMESYNHKYCTWCLGEFLRLVIGAKIINQSSVCATSVTLKSINLINFKLNIFLCPVKCQY